MAGLRAGASRVDITPDWPVELAGFALRNNAKGDQVADPLHLRVLVLEQDTYRICLVSADLLNWPRESVAAHRGVVAGIAGTQSGNVLLCGTHNHSGPQPNLTTLPSAGRPDRRYLRTFVNQLELATRQAVAALTEVVAVVGTSEYGLGANRRIPTHHGVIGGVNLDGPADPLVTMLALTDRSGRPVAELLHYTCHAVISAENVITSDFPGIASTVIEEEFGGVALYLQGCCGDINPGHVAGTTTLEARRAGEELAGSALGSLDHASSIGARLADARSGQVVAKLRGTVAPEELRRLAKGDNLPAEWARTLLQHVTRQRAEAELELQYLSLFDGLDLLAMNGELSVEYGLDIRARSRGGVLPVAYANGMAGYVPRAYQLEQGGYESIDSTLWYAMAGRFSTTVEAQLEEAIAGLIVS